MVQHVLNDTKFEFFLIIRTPKNNFFRISAEQIIKSILIFSRKAVILFIYKFNGSKILSIYLPTYLSNYKSIDTL